MDKEEWVAIKQQKHRESLEQQIEELQRELGSLDSNYEHLEKEYDKYIRRHNLLNEWLEQNDDINCGLYSVIKILNDKMMTDANGTEKCWSSMRVIMKGHMNSPFCACGDIGKHQHEG